MLQTQRLFLRSWQKSDLDPFAQMNADTEVMKYFPTTLSRQESDALVEQIESHHPLPSGHPLQRHVLYRLKRNNNC